MYAIYFYKKMARSLRLVGLIALRLGERFQTSKFDILRFAI
jgi:hypothetical protein